MAEQEDAQDLKSCGRNTIRVRFPLPVLRSFSSVGQSIRLITGRSGVQVPEAPLRTLVLQGIPKGDALFPFRGFQQEVSMIMRPNWKCVTKKRFDNQQYVFPTQQSDVLHLVQCAKNDNIVGAEFQPLI